MSKSQNQANGKQCQIDKRKVGHQISSVSGKTWTTKTKDRKMGCSVDPFFVAREGGNKIKTEVTGWCLHSAMQCSKVHKFRGPA